MSQLTAINHFLQKRTITIVGVSRNPRKFGNIVFRTLQEKGYTVFAVNQHADQDENPSFYHSMDELPPEATQNLLILTPKQNTDSVLKEGIGKGFKNVWVQQGCETENTQDIAGISNVNLVINKCILMYTEPKGFHKFHEVLYKWIGKYDS